MAAYISGCVKARLVALVVAETAVAEHIDDHRPAEALAELRRDLGAIDHRLRIVAVHVEHRCLDHLGNVGRIRRGARIHRRGGKADLVVDDEMHRAAGAMALEARKPETFGDDALAGKRRIAVDQQRHHHRAIGLLGVEDEMPVDRRALVLLGARLAQHHRIDDLEMARIGRQRQMHPVAVELAVRRSTQMVLDVARTFDILRVVGATLELVEQCSMRLHHHLGEDVKPAAMRHAQDDILDAQRAAPLDDLLERRHQRIPSHRARSGARR